MPIRIPAESNVAAPSPVPGHDFVQPADDLRAGANQTETPGPWIVVAKIMRNEQDSATGIYLRLSS